MDITKGGMSVGKIDENNTEETIEDIEKEVDKEGVSENQAEAAEETVEEDASKEEKEEETDEKKGFFKKKDKKDKKDLVIEELNDKIKRQMAEFDNFRKRTDKEKSQMYEIGAKDIIEKILPVVDNFERGLAAVKEEEKGLPFVEGMGKIYKQLMTCLEEVGVKPIEAEGNEFDPNFHNAVMHIEDEQFGDSVIVEVFQKGYKINDRVIRPAMVKTAN